MKSLTLLLSVIVIAGCAKPKPLPVYGHIDAFTLTAESGQEFQSKSLDGHPWIADFIFTHCPGPCPRMTQQLRGIDGQVRGLPVQFVSFTVDPEHDTAEVLSDYAKHYQADTGRWHFLTGPRETLNEIFRNQFKLGSVDGSFVHSTRFVLVDGEGQVRGLYSSDDADDLKKLVRDLRGLSGPS